MHRSLLGLIASAAIASACELPEGSLPNTITEGFQIQVQNASQPDVHNKYMNLDVAGGGDRHLFIGPVGEPTYNLILQDGVIVWPTGGIYAVINGEFSEIDDTTKLFMTERSDPRAYFQPTYACNPDTDEVQIELTFLGRQGDPAGGTICVRPSYDDSHEFRYYPPGNTKYNPDRPCTFVTLVMLPQGEEPSPVSSTTTSSGPEPTTSEDPEPTTSEDPEPTTTEDPEPTTTEDPEPTTTEDPDPTTSEDPDPTTSNEPEPTTDPDLPYADMTAYGFRFLGCAPEERTVDPPDGAFRTLPEPFYSDDMTNELCMDHCDTAGYAYAGTEYSRECWCGNSYAATREPGTTLDSLAGCSMECAGDDSQLCGGAAWLSLYEKCDPSGPCENRVFT